jgi:threonine dehydrogenase-like Zn-dependent dehydrogenase
MSQESPADVREQVHGDALAAVTDRGGLTTVQCFPWGAVEPDDGWLRVEASGICGTDVALADGGLGSPTVLGHHVVGTVASIGDDAARRWGVEPGAPVAVEEYLPCGRCANCRAGLYRLCPETDLWGRGRRVGLVPVSQAPALWGGNAQYMYLCPNAVVHRLPEGIAPELAVWIQPLANALDWVGRVGRLAQGETLVVLGPGYHGLAAVAAAQELGAGHVVVVGLAQDAERLGLARVLGAETFEATLHTQDQLRELTGGGLGDLVLDVGGSDPESVSTGLSLLEAQGRLVLAGIKRPSTITLDSDALVRSMHSVIGVRGRNPDSVCMSIALLERGGGGLSSVPTYETPLSQVGEILSRLAEKKGPVTPHVVVRPWSMDAKIPRRDM